MRLVSEGMGHFHTFLLAMLAAMFVLVWQAPPQHAFEGVANYLPLHTTLETASFVISFLVFGVVWNAYARERAGNLVILACVFLAVGLIDFLHTLSFKGMPVFITPADPEKAINFWLAARCIAAAGLVFVAFHPWRPLSRPGQRYVWLGGALALTVLVGLAGLFYQDALPHTFIEGRGLTPLKVAAEYALVALYAAAAIVFYARSRKPQPYDARDLATAAAISVLSELSFTLYSDVTDIFNLLGHVYKIIAYAFIYRAMFVAAVREPFTRTQEAERALRESEASVREIVEQSPIAMLVDVGVESDEKIVVMNRKFTELFGYTLEDVPDVRHWWPLAYPDEKYRNEVRGEWLRRAEEAVQTRCAIEPMEATVTCKDESKRYIRFSYVSIGARSIITFEDLTENKRAEAALQARTHDLGERVKELRGLYAISHLTERADLSLDEIFQQAVEFLPPAYQHPEITCARITFEGETYTTHNFRECVDRQAADIVLDGRKAGSVEVSYREPRPVAFEGPFLKEERDLLNVVANRLADTIVSRRAANKLSEAHQLLERMFESIHVLVAYLDRDFNFIRVNRAYATADGRTPAFFPGKNHFALYPDNEAEAIFRKVVDTGEPYTAFERPFVYAEHPERGTSYWDWRVEPVKDVGGRVESVIFSLLNVTERKRAAENLRSSRDLLQSVVENAPIRVFWKDTASRYLGSNTAFARDAGLTRPEELIGKDDFQLSWHEQAELYRDDDRRVMESDTPKLGFEEPQTTLDGRPIWLRTSKVPLHDADGKVFGVLGIYEDITERKRAEEVALIASLYARSLIEASLDPLVTISPEGKVTDVNQATEQATGLSREKLVGTDFADYFTEPDKAREGYQQVLREGVVHDYPLTLHHASGRTMDVLYNATTYKNTRGELQGVLAAARDVTERKRAEEEVRRLSRSNKLILDSAGEGIYGLDLEGQCTFVNPAAARMLGYASEEIIGQRTHELFHHTRADGSPYPEAECPIHQAHLKGQVFRGVGETYWRKDGSSFPIEYVSVPIMEDDNVVGAVASFFDITERQRAEAALRHSEDSLKEAQRIAQIGNWELDLKRNVLTWSDETFRIFEIDPTQFDASYDTFLNTIHPDDRELVSRAYADSVKNHMPYDIVHRLRMRDGRLKYVNEHCETFYDKAGEPLRSLGTVQDITARRLAEIALSRLNRALRTLSSGNEVLVHGTEEMALLREMCRVIVELGGYRMAWVGYAEQDAAKMVRPVAQFGPAEGFVDNLHVSWDEADPRGRGPTGTAIRTRQPALVCDIATEAMFAPWREAALRHGLGSSIALPLIEDGRALGVLNIYAAEPQDFDKDEVALLTELATDLAYGIITLRTRQEQQKGEALLRETLTDTIRAISLTLEKRDPYTAGHQQRVAELCTAIGLELGLEPGRIEGLRLGATIHDIGKIYVPAEILNRPGTLTNAEFEIIKSHPQVGYDIVKDVNFPWPVAQMILQHHERLDGSGYPNHLKGDEILFEARILSVADVVEAMAAHRPYRAARGTTTALDEIKTNRGRLYDPAVVDACLRVFEKNGDPWTQPNN